MPRLTSCVRRDATCARRSDARVSHYGRKLGTQAGQVTLRVPKVRSLPFETAIIERYRRSEASVERALVENVPRGSVGATGQTPPRRRCGARGWGRGQREDILAHRGIALPGIVGSFRTLTFTVILKCSLAVEVKNGSVLVSIGVGTFGYRKVLGVAEYPRRLARSQKPHGCSRPSTPRRTAGAVANANEVVSRLRTRKPTTAAALVEQEIAETLTYYPYLSTHWRQIPRNNALERDNSRDPTLGPVWSARTPTGTPRWCW